MLYAQTKTQLGANLGLFAAWDRGVRYYVSSVSYGGGVPPNPNTNPNPNLSLTPTLTSTLTLTLTLTLIPGGGVLVHDGLDDKILVSFCGAP